MNSPDWQMFRRGRANVTKWRVCWRRPFWWKRRWRLWMAFGIWPFGRRAMRDGRVAGIASERLRANQRWRTLPSSNSSARLRFLTAVYWLAAAPVCSCPPTNSLPKWGGSLVDAFLGGRVESIGDPTRNLVDPVNTPPKTACLMKFSNNFDTKWPIAEQNLRDFHRTTPRDGRTKHPAFPSK